MSISEATIHLSKFKPRDYQLPIFDALENKEYRRVLAILPRRAGKDICGFNLVLRAALRKIGVYYYIFPTYAQGKKVIWDSITNDGDRFLDYIPKELIRATNSQEMKITLNNGSLIQIVGSDNFDSLMGTNPRGVVFSEYALQDPRAYQYIRPILIANEGWALFLSTPRGKNHLWELYKRASESPEWFCLKLTVENTKHISLEEIERDRADGEMSEDLIQQEYYTSFTMGVEGSYYAKYIDRMRLNGQIGLVPHQTGTEVHTAWDLGVRDSTCIIFFQVVGQVIRVIDCYDKTKEGLEHYARVLRDRENREGYIYGRHIAPHDMANQEWGSGLTRLEKAKQLGIPFMVLEKHDVNDGIETVRTTFSSMWIDERKCVPLIKAIENYRQVFDPKNKVYNPHPLHDWSSHYADAMRYLCMGQKKLRKGKTPEDLAKIRYEAQNQGRPQLPPVFQDDPGGGRGWM